MFTPDNSKYSDIMVIWIEAHNQKYIQNLRQYFWNLLLLWEFDSYLQNPLKKEDICEVLDEFINVNPGKQIILVLDNFSSYRSKMIQEFALKNNISLLFLPPYSPDLNPIEQIWRSIKREISKTFIRDYHHLISTITEEFYDRIMKKSYIKGWANKFLSSLYYSKMLCD